MRSRIRKWGNSLAVRIPHAFALQARLYQGSPIELSVENGRVVIEPVVSNIPTLDELLAAVSPENLQSEFETGPAQGNETW